MIQYDSMLVCVRVWKFKSMHINFIVVISTLNLRIFMFKCAKQLNMHPISVKTNGPCKRCVFILFLNLQNPHFSKSMLDYLWMRCSLKTSTVWNIIILNAFFMWKKCLSKIFGKVFHPKDLTIFLASFKRQQKQSQDCCHQLSNENLQEF